MRRIEPAAFTKTSTLGVEEQRVNVLIDVTSPPETWRGLGDAYQVDARITVFSQEDATIGLADALFRKDGNWHVFVVVGSRAEVGAVLSSAIWPVWRSLVGRAIGNGVIVYPSDRIASGARVASP